MNILSIRVADAAVVGVKLAMCGRRKDKYNKSKKFEISDLCHILVYLH